MITDYIVAAWLCVLTMFHRNAPEHYETDYIVAAWCVYDYNRNAPEHYDNYYIVAAWLCVWLCFTVTPPNTMITD